MTALDCAPFLQGAFDDFAAAQVKAAVDPLQQQLTAATAQLQATQALLTQDHAQLTDAQQKLTAAQAQLANALAAGVAEQSTITALQHQVADLQAQLASLLPGKAPAPPAGYATAFLDEMNGSLGPLWTVGTGTADNELSARTVANVVASADHLTIVSRREASSGKQFTSGYVTTAPHFSLPFGRWEIRARWDDLFGMWPAIWLRFDNAVGEIDIMEAVGGIRKIVQTAHQNTNGKQDKSGFEWAMPDGWKPSDFHTYGVERFNTGVLAWSVDDVVTRRIAPTDLSTQLHQPMSWLTGTEYAGPAHLIINQQVGGSMPNWYVNGSTTKPIDVTKILPGTTEAHLQIDWARALTPLSAAA